MSVEDRRIETAIGRAVEEIHRLVNGPEDAYKVAMGALLKVLHAYNYTIPAEDVKKLAMRTELKINLSSEKREPVDASTHVDGLVKALLDTLENGDAGLPAEAADKLSKFVIRDNVRTVGVIVDAPNQAERYDTRMPVMSNDISNQVMDLVERLGNGGWHVDKRAWDHLLIYIPKYQKLKKRFKRFKRFFGKV